MWQQLDVGATDPILQMLAAYHADPNPDKIDLGIGVYKDSAGNTPIFKAVKKAEKWLLKHESSKAYLGPAGDVEFNTEISRLLLAEDYNPETTLCLQTPGGTGALRVAGDLISRARTHGCIWLSNPPWVTHRSIYQSAGLRLQYYRYFDPATQSTDFTGMKEDLKEAMPGDVVLLQTTAHNPTGCNLSAEQWEEIALLLRDREALPLLDIAYQGLDESLHADLSATRIIRQLCPEWIICYSASKTFGLYNERAGALLIKTSNSLSAVRQEALNRICANYYMPPAHGAAIIRTILQSEELKNQWQQELADAREQLKSNRMLFCNRLNAISAWQYRLLGQQKGMFSYLGLSERQLQYLRSEHSIYAGSGGRINVAGISQNNVRTICDAILQCSKATALKAP
ncbi:amino acid aminotransferase [Marinobacterium jannaschii]|uniref:amino acid aminotransferase n=1 Tax=Marinobacterium jannaschii TaxID=64970 RepID=UPI0004860291|nr:aromatic amino acid transaminase [Marinobacterium jannaschii]